jgi:hypothetical protein
MFRLQSTVIVCFVITFTHKQTSYAGEVDNIQIEKTIANNGLMNKSNTQAAIIEIPI